MRIGDLHRADKSTYCAPSSKGWAEDTKSTISFVVTMTRRVSRNIDVESGMHLLIRVIRRRVSHHCDPVAKLSGKANGRLRGMYAR